MDSPRVTERQTGVRARYLDVCRRSWTVEVRSVEPEVTGSSPVRHPEQKPGSGESVSRLRRFSHVRQNYWTDQSATERERTVPAPAGPESMTR